MANNHITWQTIILHGKQSYYMANNGNTCNSYVC